MTIAVRDFRENIIPEKHLIERFKEFRKEYGTHKTWCATNKLLIEAASCIVSYSCDCGFSDFDDIS